jgi:hypothetical protein
MATKREQSDARDDAQLVRLWKAYGDGAAMRPAFVAELARQLDDEFLQERSSENEIINLSGHGAAALSTRSKDEEPQSVVASARRVHSFNRVRAAVLFVAASSLLAVVAAWNGRPAYGWATMIDALDRSQWVRAETTNGEGTISGWGSAASGIVAVQSDEMVEFADSRRGSRSAFRRDQTNLYEVRGVESPLWQWENEVVRLLIGLESLAKPDAAAPLGESVRVTVESEAWSRVEREGRELIELKVALRVQAGEASTRRVALQLLIDPESHLPLECWLLNAAGEKTQSFKFEYPQEGPGSIYSLGVPVTTPVVKLKSLSDLASLRHSEVVKPELATSSLSEDASQSLAGRLEPSAESPSRQTDVSWSPSAEPLPEGALSQKVDELLAVLWQSQGIQPTEAANDLEFMRRVYLDLAGRIPRVSEVRSFEADASEDRRKRLVDRLLADRDHATNLAAVWRRMLLPDDVDLSRLGGHEKFEEWLADQFGANVPYDQIVRNLLLAEGRVSESGPLIFFGAVKLNPEELAARTSRVFLGTRMECAQCHDHPFDNVSQRDFWSFAAFFARLSRPQGKMEMTSPVLRVHDSPFGEVTIPESNEIVRPKLPMTDSEIQESEDSPARRTQLVDWLTAPTNAHFARATVNRAWAHLFGRGLVDPVDDMRPDNAAIAPEVLDTLSRDFAASGFDMRRLLQAIVLTRAYQLSSRAATDEPARALCFAQMSIKSLNAEQLYDCIAVATQRAPANGGGPSSTSLERFIDNDRRAFIEQFRAPGQAIDYHAGIPQALTLMHGALVHNGSDLSTSGLLRSLEAPFFTTDERVTTLYLATLSRPPTNAERALIDSAIATTANEDERRIVLGDLLWALLNSAEFTFNH